MKKDGLPIHEANEPVSKPKVLKPTHSFRSSCRTKPDIAHRIGLPVIGSLNGNRCMDSGNTSFKSTGRSWSPASI